MNVPCDGCTRCCKNDVIRLLSGDDPTLYKTVPHPYLSEALMLDHAENGDCVYLGDQGCTIHDTKPQLCREMDCRNIAAMINYTQARKLAKDGTLHFGVWLRGKELLK